MIDEKYPLIEALKKYKANFNKSQFISLPTNTNFGNLNIIWMQIVVRTESCNSEIINIYDDFYNSKKELVLNGTVDVSLEIGYKEIMKIEQLFYWLRKTSDELISLIFILSYFKENTRYPLKIKVSSIGEFLNKEKCFDGGFDKFKSILLTLNEISNGYKHSFINSQLNSYSGSVHPVVFAYLMKYNDSKNSAEFRSIDLKVFLKEYDDFLKFTKKYIELMYVNE
ncbi:hypothetical protein [Flavobacterium degerlachei]|jgi:hypothetical protein|uniref:Uncharacterized protein n=1 Tax=Flavobacterium degerlachei TaxID=229203 RepID=A0A1H2R8L8_9FLAO|nr:hypothetical protein [Flavobacterium degerlachei]SDW15826.1 hypothetical protein SAMN05444338_101364 [Flavobacterium degerlachei]